LNGLLTTRQARKILGVNLFTLYKYIYSGSLKAHKLGKSTNKTHWRIKQVDLEAFINGQAGAESEHTEPQNNNEVRSGADSALAIR